MTDKLRRMEYKLRGIHGIYVTVSAMREALKNQLDQEPTDNALKYFINYVEVDITQWLRDNAKAFMEHLKE